MNPGFEEIPSDYESKLRLSIVNREFDNSKYKLLYAVTKPVGKY